MKSFGRTSPVKYLFLSAALVASFSPCGIYADGDAAKEEKIELANAVNEKAKEQNAENQAALEAVANKGAEVEAAQDDAGFVSDYVVAPVVATAAFVATYTGLEFLYNNGLLPFIAGAAAGVVAKTAYDAYNEDEIDFDC